MRHLTATPLMTPPPAAGSTVATRLARSVLCREGGITDLADFHRWLSDLGARSYTNANPVRLHDVRDWVIDPNTGDISHRSGKFFSIQGLDIRNPGGKVERWAQPIINQPETGILGMLVKEFDGVLHFLVQAKAEPGNLNGLQVAPTVQATRSNYTRVHGGAAVPYLKYFQQPSGHQAVADVRQSEQGAWFHKKRNRNMVAEATEDIQVLEGFRWLTLGQLYQLLSIEDLVNMDTRTVLSCLPLASPGLYETFAPVGDFQTALLRSMDPAAAGLHTTGEVLNWITDARTRVDVQLERVPLLYLPNWGYEEGRIVHDSGLFFDVIGVDIEAVGREVTRWMQPMIRPAGTGVIGLLVTRIDGVLHGLMHAHIEPGYVDVVELAPTVQCTPENYRYLPAAARPEFLDHVLAATADQVRFDTTLSEEGGRFYHALNRYLVIEVEPDDVRESAHYRWLTLHQLTELLKHSYYVNVQARSLVACLHSLSGAAL